MYRKFNTDHYSIELGLFQFPGWDSLKRCLEPFHLSTMFVYPPDDVPSWHFCLVIMNVTIISVEVYKNYVLSSKVPVVEKTGKVSDLNGMG